MKIIVTHLSPDLDAITSIWLIKRFLPSWSDAKIRFVPAGTRLGNFPYKSATDDPSDPVELIGGNQVIHVDTGLGPLDHHQTQDQRISAAKLTFNFVARFEPLSANKHKKEAVLRIVNLIVEGDHFQEVFYPDPLSLRYDLSLDSLLSGLKVMLPRANHRQTNFILRCLDILLHYFELRLFAEEEIKEKGIEFETRVGKGLAIETGNDEVMKLGILMGYAVVVRKDPKYGFIRIKARPQKSKAVDSKGFLQYSDLPIDLKPVYERIKRVDPSASWFLHVSGRMLLNGSSKNPKVKNSRLSLREIIDILKEEI